MGVFYYIVFSVVVSSLNPFPGFQLGVFCFLLFCSLLQVGNLERMQRQWRLLSSSDHMISTQHRLSFPTLKNMRRVADGLSVPGIKVRVQVQPFPRHWLCPAKSHLCTSSGANTSLRSLVRSQNNTNNEQQVDWIAASHMRFLRPSCYFTLTCFSFRCFTRCTCC